MAVEKQPLSALYVTTYALIQERSLFLGKKSKKIRSPYRNKLGIVLSEPYYVEEFKVEEYLNFVGKIQKIGRDEIRNRIQETLIFFDLLPYRNTRIKKLSAGNKMKLSLTTALIHNPQLLVFDEPFLNMDIATIETLKNLLNSLKTKKTLFITSHNLDLIIELCDRFLILQNGNISLDLPKSEFNSSAELIKFIKQHMTTKSSPPSSISWL